MGMTLTTLLASHTHDWDHHGWWPLWPLLWIAAIVTILWVIKRRRWSPQSGSDRARDILAERYARGEIASDEYRERLEQLR
jgi:putative membrane protein